jgi:hypothetical protein
MHLQNSQNYAIFGSSVTLSNLNTAQLTAPTGLTSSLDGEDSIQINNLFGTGATDNALTKRRY